MPLPDDRIRLADLQDAPAMLNIYTPYVKDTLITFEYEPPALAEFSKRIEARAGMLPWVVYEREGCVAGYAYASRFSEREAYSWTVETSVYIDKSLHGSGIGRRLYTALFAILRAQGCRNAYACITVPNPESEGFHEKMGFSRGGTLENVGYKFGEWRHIADYVLQLQEFSVPEPLIPLAQFSPRVLKDAFAGAMQ